MSFATDLTRIAFGGSRKSRFGRVGTALTVANILRRNLKQRNEIVYVSEIKPGDRLEIIGLATQSASRRARKKAARRK